jgi:hypothetical protein
MSPFAGLATGVGSWPGTDPLEAATIVLNELGQLPHLVELPARGIGADMVGRTGAILVDIPIDLSPTGYRLDGTAGAVARRARDLLRHDLDALEEAWERGGFAGSGTPLKVQAAGPLTLAAELELRGGHRALTDRGAVRDLAGSLAEGLRAHITEVGRRLQTPVVAQLDEPRLPAVLAGALAGVSIMQTVPAMPEPDALALLDEVIGACEVPVLVHSCAGSAPFALLRRSSAAAVGFDLSTVSGAAAMDQLGELIDAGKALMVGAVPAVAPPQSAPGDFAKRTAGLFERLGFGPKVLEAQVSIAPACGLAGATPAWARQALRMCGSIQRDLVEMVAEA